MEESNIGDAERDRGIETGVAVGDLGSGKNEKERESATTDAKLARQIPDIDLFGIEGFEGKEEVKPSKPTSRQAKDSKQKKSDKIDERTERIYNISQKTAAMIQMVRPSLAEPIVEGAPSLLDVGMLNMDEARVVAEFQEAWHPVGRLTKKQRERIEKAETLIALGVVVGTKIYAINQLISYRRELDAQNSTEHVPDQHTNIRATG